MSLFSDSGWLAWVALALALAAFEAASVDFVFVMLAGGALAAAVAAGGGASFTVQVITAVVVATALLLMARPIVKRRFMVPARPRGDRCCRSGRSIGAGAGDRH